MTGSLFDTRPPAPTPARQEPAPVAPPAPRRQSFGPGVVRVIEFKDGPFTRVLEGQAVARYYILEMRNGLYFQETTEGHRYASPWINREMVEASIAAGMWRVVA